MAPAPRVLLALDPGISSVTALQAVASLCGGGTEVIALYVEDVTLLRLAQLPVVCEITMDAGRRSLEPARIEAQFRAQAARLRALLEDEASRMGVSCEFLVTRGEFPAELMRAAAVADVLVLIHSRVDVVRSRAGQMLLADLLTLGPPTLLFVQERWATGQRVVVLASGTGWERTVHFALAMADREGLELVVLVGPSQPDGAAVRSLLAGSGTRAAGWRLRTIVGASPGELLRAASAEQARVMVLPAEAAAHEPTLVSELLRRAECSVVTVRG